MSCNFVIGVQSFVSLHYHYQLFLWMENGKFGLGLHTACVIWSITVTLIFVDAFQNLIVNPCSISSESAMCNSFVCLMCNIEGRGLLYWRIESRRKHLLDVVVMVWDKITRLKVHMKNEKNIVFGFFSILSIWVSSMRNHWRPYIFYVYDFGQPSLL